MRRDEFGDSVPGELVEITDPRGNRGLAFLPNELPPTMDLPAGVWPLAEEAAFALGNLNGLGSQLPNPTMLAQPFARKEALASSRIEGTRADFGQLALFEEQASIDDEHGDIREVLNYVRALEIAWNTALPVVSLTGIASLHDMLLRGVRGEELYPGSYRTRPVFIGARRDSIASARFVPCPPAHVRDRLQNLVDYALQRDRLPALVQLAIIHYQFEAIHPFNDGNGRVGRLLIPLILREWGLLDHPLLYLSEYFERNRDQYIDGLYRVSVENDWTGWIEFFLHALSRQAVDARHRAESLLQLRDQMRAVYQSQGKPRVLVVIDALFERPTMTFGRAQKLTGLQPQGANAIVKGLVADGVLIEMTGRRRNQVFYAPDIAFASLGVGTVQGE